VLQLRHLGGQLVVGRPELLMRGGQLRMRATDLLQFAGQFRDPDLLRLPMREELLAGQIGQVGHPRIQTGP